MSRKSYARTDRLRSLLLEILAEQLESIDDPALGFAFFSAVMVDKDLNRAQVFFSSLDWGDASGDTLRQAQAETAQALSEHKGSFRRAMAKQAHLRRIPELVFVPDESFRHGAHIEETLRQLKEPTAAGRNERGYTLQTLIITAVLALMAVAAGVVIVAITRNAQRNVEDQTFDIDEHCTNLEVYDSQVAAAGLRGSNAGVLGSDIGCVPACVSEWHRVEEYDDNGNRVYRNMNGDIVAQNAQGAMPAFEYRGFIIFKTNVSSDLLIDSAHEMEISDKITMASQTERHPVHVYIGPDTVYGENGPIPVVQPGTARVENISLETSEGEFAVQLSLNRRKCTGLDYKGDLIIFEEPPPPPTS